MFRKVLKHDINAILRFWLIMTATVLALGVIGGLCIRALSTVASNPNQLPFVPLYTLGIIVSVMAMSVYAVGTIVLMMVRFYKNFFTDEGYLTFTLPVKRSTLFNSKLLTAFIFNTATTVVLGISITVLLAIAPGGETASSALGELINGIRVMIISLAQIMTDKVTLWIIAYAVVGVIYLLVYFVHETLLIFCTVTFGSIIAKKHKILMSIGVYYGVQMILSIFWSLVSTFLSFGIEALAAAPVIEGEAILGFLLALCIYYILIIALLACFYYKFAVNKLRGNLNLA